MKVTIFESKYTYELTEFLVKRNIVSLIFKIHNIWTTTSLTQGSGKYTPIFNKSIQLLSYPNMPPFPICPLLSIGAQYLHLF